MTNTSSRIAINAKNGVMRRAQTHDPNALAAAAPTTNPSPLFHSTKMLNLMALKKWKVSILNTNLPTGMAK